MSSRRKAREAVLKALYVAESRKISVKEAFDEMSDFDKQIEKTYDSEHIDNLKPFSLGLGEEQKIFAFTLAENIEINHIQLNEQIIPVLKNWDFSRISRIDRIILWIAIAEMIFIFDIPKSVSINEAIELAKKYSSPQSPPFINGVLDAVSKNIGLKQNI